MYWDLGFMRLVLVGLAILGLGKSLWLVGWFIGVDQRILRGFRVLFLVGFVVWILLV